MEQKYLLSRGAVSTVAMDRQKLTDNRRMKR